MPLGLVDICRQTLLLYFVSGFGGHAMRRLILLALAALPAFASAITSAAISGLDTAVVTGTATVFYTDPSGDPFISASANAIGLTLGPVRDGFIAITAQGGANSGGASHGTVGSYTFGCTDFGCSPANDFNGTKTWLPFTLGVPFQISVSAGASSIGWGSGDILFSFSVAESVTPIPGYGAYPGEAVTIYDPPAVPEPPTTLLCAGGLALLAARRRIREGRNP